MEKRILIGYWKLSEDDGYPDPNDLVDEEFWEDVDKKYYLHKAAFICYLQSGIPCNHYRGFSSCRVCGEMLGSHERHDDTYIWPDKLDHYVSHHNVRLPMEFIEHVARSYKQQIEKNFDPWLGFAKCWASGVYKR